MTKMLEKRRYQRLDVRLPVILRYQGRLVPATILNLSCGGACIHTENQDLDMDSSVELIFDLDAGQRDVSMRGSVVRREKFPLETDGCTAGIRFSNLFSDGHKAVQDYLRKNLN
jgi:hypothetical protein